MGKLAVFEKKWIVSSSKTKTRFKGIKKITKKDYSQSFLSFSTGLMKSSLKSFGDNFALNILVCKLSF